MSTTENKIRSKEEMAIIQAAADAALAVRRLRSEIRPYIYGIDTFILDLQEQAGISDTRKK